MAQGPENPIPQACAIPYRIVDKRIEVCVVTSRRKQRWVFPKGLVEPNETPREAALKEAREEAGLRGHLVDDVVGSYQRSRWGVTFVVDCFLMHVDHQQRTWRESSMRRRAWLPLEDALVQIGPRGQRDVLAVAARRLKRRGSQAG